MSTALNQSLCPSVAGLAAYINKVLSAPELSEDVERSLITQLRERNDLAAAKELIISHLRYVVYISRQYSGYGLPEEDLIQEGNVGLMKALKRFDPDRGLRLRSYAAYWIKAEILEFVVSRWRMVKVATTHQKRKLFFKLRQEKKRLAWLAADEAETIAQRLGVEPRAVVEMDGYLYQHDCAIVPKVCLEGAEVCEEELVSDLPRPEVELEMKETDTLQKNALIEALGILDDRSMHIIKQRWLGDSKTTLETLAAQYAVSPERIRQIERAAMAKLRKHIDNSLGAVHD